MARVQMTERSWRGTEDAGRTVHSTYLRKLDMPVCCLIAWFREEMWYVFLLLGFETKHLCPFEVCRLHSTFTPCLLSWLPPTPHSFPLLESKKSWSVPLIYLTSLPKCLHEELFLSLPSISLPGSPMTMVIFLPTCIILCGEHFAYSSPTLVFEIKLWHWDILTWRTTSHGQHQHSHRFDNFPYAISSNK
jgi:hypothetical protein